MEKVFIFGENNRFYEKKKAKRKQLFYMLHCDCSLKAWQPIGKYVCIRKKFRKRNVNEDIHSPLQTTAQGYVIALLLAFQKALYQKKKKKKSEKSTFALVGKMTPSVICYSIL